MAGPDSFPSVELHIVVGAKERCEEAAKGKDKSFSGVWVRIDLFAVFHACEAEAYDASRSFGFEKAGDAEQNGVMLWRGSAAHVLIKAFPAFCVPGFQEMAYARNIGHKRIAASS